MARALSSAALAPAAVAPIALATPSVVTAAPQVTGTGEPPVGIIVLTVMLGLVMSIIDASIVNVALPQMAGNLGAATDEISWVATGYILANVVVMPLNGWLTARFGRKHYYAASLAIFTLASVACGLSHDVVSLVFWRLVQGAGGGALQPTAQSILFESFPPEKRGQAMAIFGLGAMVGPAIGPSLGGYIVENTSWPLIFFINLPIGIVALVMTFAYIRDPSYIVKPTKGIDWLALGAMTTGIASLQYVLERGQREDWFESQTIVVLSILSVVSLGFFIARELRSSEPMVNLRVFGSRSFAAGCTVGIVSGFGLYGLNLILPLFLQNVLAFGAFATGLALVPGAIATALSMPLAGRLVAKVDPRAVIALGLAMFAAGAWWMGDLDQNSGWDQIFWPRILQGFALGFLFVPLTTITLAEIPRAAMAGATGLYTLVRQLGGSLGIAILVLLQTRREDDVQQTLANTVTLANPMLHSMAQAQGGMQAALGVVSGQVVLVATTISYDYVFRVSAILFAVTMPMVFLMKRPARAGDAVPAAAAAIE